MSLTIQQMILDAKRLATRLKKNDLAADFLLSQAQSVYKQVDAMKQYQDEVNELNEAARQRPHSVLVAGIKQENRHLRDLQQENKELRDALEDHQTTIALIMTKYRQHITQLVSDSKLDLASLHNNIYSQVLSDQSNKIQEMAAVMDHAATLDEKKAFSEQETIARLTTENKGLRELLEISCKFGSLRQNLLGVTNVEKEIQTESDPSS